MLAYHHLTAAMAAVFSFSLFSFFDRPRGRYFFACMNREEQRIVVRGENK